MCNSYFCKYGIPNTIMSDCGKEFLNETLKEICKTLEIQLSPTMAYSPRSNAISERSHKIIIESLRTLTDNRLYEWDQQLPYVQIAYNTSVHTQTGYTPHYLFYGRNPRNIFSIDAVPNYNIDSYKNVVLRNLKIATDEVRKRNQEENAQTKQNPNSHNFKVGDHVMLKNIFNPHQPTKLQPRYIWSI